MALKALLTADEHGKLDQATKAHYRDGAGIGGGGKYVLDVEPAEGYSLEDVSGLKSALAKEKADLTRAKATIQAFEGLDATKAREALAKVDDMKNWKPEDNVREQIEAIKRELVEKHGTERTKLETDLKHLREQLERHLVVASATQALVAAKGNTELLLPHVQRQVRVEQDAKGDFVARVVDKDGNPRISTKPGSTDPMTIEDLVGTMRDSATYAPAFAGSGASGGGSQQSGGTGRNGSAIDPNLPPAERLKLAHRAAAVRT